MDKEVFQLYRYVKTTWCDECGAIVQCDECAIKGLLAQIEDLKVGEVAQDSGCHICESGKDIFYFDAANNMRSAIYCPNCGKKR